MGSAASEDTRAVDVRVTARSVEGDRIEFAIQRRLPDGNWSERLYGARRFFGPAQRDGRWKVATPVQVEVPLVPPTETPTVTATPNSDNRITISLGGGWPSGERYGVRIWHNARADDYPWTREPWQQELIETRFEGVHDKDARTLTVSKDNVKAILVYERLDSSIDWFYYLSPILREAIGNANDPNPECVEGTRSTGLYIGCDRSDEYVYQPNALLYWKGVPRHLEMNLFVGINSEENYRAPYPSERQSCENSAIVSWKLNDTEVTQTQPNVNPYSYSRTFNINSNSNVALLVDGTNTISATYCRVKYRAWRGRQLAESFETRAPG